MQRSMILKRVQKVIKTEKTKRIKIGNKIMQLSYVVEEMVGT